jgi:soluble lytic murein transglycosylase-like protein
MFIFLLLIILVILLSFIIVQNINSHTNNCIHVGKKSIDGGKKSINSDNNIKNIQLHTYINTNNKLTSNQLKFYYVYIAYWNTKNNFDHFIEQTAYKHQVDSRLVRAVIETESAYNVTAQSPKGAVGLMQLMPDTAKRFGVVDPTNPQQNVDGGTRYLKYLINLFKPNLGLALAAYNAGENAVLRNNNQIPPYPETQNYVRQVLSLYRQKTAFN